MKNHIYILLLALVFLLLSCGVKNGYMVGEYGKQPLAGQTINGADTSSKAMLGLLWQKDSLRITLNQGRHLRADQSQIEKNGWYPGSTTVENSALSGRFGEKGLGAIGFKAFTMDDQGRLWFFQRDDINAI